MICLILCACDHKCRCEHEEFLVELVILFKWFDLVVDLNRDGKHMIPIGVKLWKTLNCNNARL